MDSNLGYIQKNKISFIEAYFSIHKLALYVGNIVKYLLPLRHFTPYNGVLLNFIISLRFISLFRMLEKRSLSYVDGPVPVPTDDSFLSENVNTIQICDTGQSWYFIKRAQSS